MGRVYENIRKEQARWIGKQPMFFVATAAPRTRTSKSHRRGLTRSGYSDRIGSPGLTSRVAASRP
jgi:hypothetical protein